MNINLFHEKYREILKEIINIAMGRAGDALAKLLDSFIELSVPNMRIIDSNQMREIVIDMIGEILKISAVRQTFHNHLSGEAVTIFSQKGCSELSDLLGYEDKSNEPSDDEILLDVSNIIVGACLNSIEEQLDTGHEINYSPPILLCKETPINEMLIPCDASWKHALLLRIAFKIENRSFSCHVLILMPEESIEHMGKALDKWLEVL